NPPPYIEQLEHVPFAELDPDRPPARPFRVVALAIPIDAAKDDLQRNTGCGPAAYLFECRADNAHEMSFVLARQIRFDFAAVLASVHVLSAAVQRLAIERREARRSGRRVTARARDCAARSVVIPGG